jgi:hypothetical protein
MRREPDIAVLNIGVRNAPKAVVLNNNTKSP